MREAERSAQNKRFSAASSSRALWIIENAASAPAASIFIA